MFKPVYLFSLSVLKIISRAERQKTRPVVVECMYINTGTKCCEAVDSVIHTHPAGSDVNYLYMSVVTYKAIRYLTALETVVKTLHTWA